MTEAETAPSPAREVGVVETMKALADPTRLRILQRLMTRDKTGELPVLSVKELAAELAEPQTKLYRHVKQLEAVNLISAVSSRVVSGIVEQRYQACQGDLSLGPGLTDEQKKTAEAEATVAAALELYRGQFFAAHRAGAIVSEDTPGAPEHRKMLLCMNLAKVPREEAASFRARLQQLLDDLSDAEQRAIGRDDNVTAYALAGFFCPDPDQAS
ncbi:MAG TPA: helix-turn-helix domain-containing protein [Streptosporangiaceae bacterium]|nr:helix-turn-helix domain-containing protein [Streptosporangiaceae bacterium]